MARTPFITAKPGVLTTWNGWNGPVLSNTTVEWDKATETVTGVSRRIPQGWKDPTPYQFLGVYYSRAYGEMRIKTHSSATSGARYSKVIGSTGGGFNSLDHFNEIVLEGNVRGDLGLRQLALVAARNKLKSTDINLGVAFGERKQTARLIGDTASRIGKSVRHLKSGRIRKAMDELGISSRKREPRGSNVPSKWLEMQYGWKPLLSDVYGATDALSKHPNDHWRVTAKATRSRNTSYAKIRAPVGTNGPESNFDAFSGGCKVFTSVFARIDAIPSNELTISLASVGVTNPLLVAWELVPFSFVVDWFIPIGNYVESLDAMLGYSAGVYSSSLYITAEWVGSGLSRDWPNGTYVHNNFTETKKLVEVNRTVSQSIPLPRLPRFKDPRSLGHMANGLALLSQVFGRR